MKRLITFPLLLLCLALIAQDSLSDKSVFKEFSNQEFLKNWQLTLVGQGEATYTETRNIVKSGFRGGLSIASRNVTDRFLIEASYSYKDEDNGWFRSDLTKIHFTTDIEYFKRITNDLSFGLSLVFQDIRIKERYADPDPVTFIGLKPSAEINLIPLENADKLAVNLIIGAGPHLIIENKNTSLEYFHTIDVQTYYAFRRFLTFFNGQLINNFENVEASRFKLESGCIMKIYKGVSMHLGVGLSYHDEEFSDRAYVLDVPKVIVEESNATFFTFLIGLNVRLGPQSWKNFNTRFL